MNNNEWVTKVTKEKQNERNKNGQNKFLLPSTFPLLIL